eukprot:5655165-Pleurochrysis_carterae.AAC.2
MGTTQAHLRTCSRTYRDASAKAPTCMHVRAKQEGLGCTRLGEHAVLTHVPTRLHPPKRLQPTRPVVRRVACATQGADLVECLPMGDAGYPEGFMPGAQRLDSGGRPSYIVMPMVRARAKMRAAQRARAWLRRSVRA